MNRLFLSAYAIGLLGCAWFAASEMGRLADCVDGKNGRRLSEFYSRKHEIVNQCLVPAIASFALFPIINLMVFAICVAYQFRDKTEQKS